MSPDDFNSLILNSFDSNLQRHIYNRVQYNSLSGSVHSSINSDYVPLYVLPHGIRVDEENPESHFLYGELSPRQYNRIEHSLSVLNRGYDCVISTQRITRILPRSRTVSVTHSYYVNLGTIWSKNFTDSSVTMLACLCYRGRRKMHVVTSSEEASRNIPNLVLIISRAILQPEYKKIYSELKKKSVGFFTVCEELGIDIIYTNDIHNKIFNPIPISKPKAKTVQELNTILSSFNEVVFDRTAYYKRLEEEEEKWMAGNIGYVNRPGQWYLGTEQSAQLWEQELDFWYDSGVHADEVEWELEDDLSYSRNIVQYDMEFVPLPGAPNYFYHHILSEWNWNFPVPGLPTRVINIIDDVEEENNLNSSVTPESSYYPLED